MQSLSSKAWYTKATAVVSGYTLNSIIITGDDYFTGKVGSFTVFYVYSGSDSTGAGTVSYIFITNNNAGSGSGSGTGVGSSFTTEYTVASNGKLNATVAYTAASWVKDAGAQNVTADVEVYANGAYYDTIEDQVFAVGTDGKVSKRLVIPTAQNDFATDETLTFKMVDEAPDKVAVQYVD